MMVDINSTHNYTRPFHFKDHPESISLLITSLICVFTSVLYSFLIKKKLSGLNTIIKTILYFMAGGSFICNLIVSVNISLMYFWSLQNLIITCTMNRISHTVNYFNIIVSLALISQVRYYIAVKTSQIKAYNKKSLHYIIAAVYILSLGGVIIVINIGIHYGRAPIINKCSGRAEVDNTKYNIGLMIYGPFALMIVIINLIGDISMLFFIWKRKSQVSPAQLIPWKSISKSEDNDMAVPVHATALSVVSLIVIVIIISIVAKFNLASLDLAPVLLFALNRLWINVVIPYVMFFKIIKTKKPKPIIPKGLQMHEEDDVAAIECKDVNEEVNEMADLNLNINDRQKLGETNSRKKCQDFSNEVILDPKGLKFGLSNCTKESIEVPIMM